jgi:hypothetical protein
LRRYDGGPAWRDPTNGIQDLLVGPLFVYRGFDEYYRHESDPTGASAEQGERIHDRLGEELETILCERHTNNWLRGTMANWLRGTMTIGKFTFGE